MRCVAFSPYVSGTNPDTGPHPPAALIDTLLDRVRYRAGFNCILTYGFLNGLDYVIDAAHSRGMKVIAGIWLDTDPAVNAASITAGIAKANQYPETILRLSCGVELRNRRGAAVSEPIIQDCLARLRNAGVTQPLTSIDTWWQWCNEAWPGRPRGLAAQVDWIGISNRVEPKRTYCLFSWNNYDGKHNLMVRLKIWNLSCKYHQKGKSYSPRSSGKACRSRSWWPSRSRNIRVAERSVFFTGGFILSGLLFGKQFLAPRYRIDGKITSLLDLAATVNNPAGNLPIGSHLCGEINCFAPSIPAVVAHQRVQPERLSAARQVFYLAPHDHHLNGHRNP